ncbi:hypothetical protein PRNP1_003399 [Phytophthora ramorum]
MPSLRALFGFALLALSTAQDVTTGRTSDSSTNDANKEMLLAALDDVSAYSDNVDALVCVYEVNTLETQAVSATGAANDNFGVTGCKVDTEFVGRCPDLTTFPSCGNYNIVVSSESKAGTNKVTSITAQKSVSGGKCRTK